MKIFDFNIHLPVIRHADVNIVVQEDLNMEEGNLIEGLDQHYKSFSRIKGANFLLFNTNLLGNSISSFKKSAEDKMEHVSYTTLIDFRRPDLNSYLEKVKAEGIQMIMFNSYIQKIEEAEYELVYKACLFAENKGITICIDGSYGTSKMYVYDNLKLACYIADRITKTSIVIIHSGGYKIMEMMLLALDKNNIFFDTSFSLPYYIGSSLEQDYAYAYKKIGLHKIFFGSDYPYMDFEDSLKIHLDFFEKHNFTVKEIESILYDNAVNFIKNK
jgi:predicted TIM-barrel fold metal-dependent hydrolase